MTIKMNHKDCGPNPKTNDGTVITKVGGMRIKEVYGKDDSDISGTPKQERGGDIAGGLDYIGHSIKGSTANLKGK